MHVPAAFTWIDVTVLGILSLTVVLLVLIIRLTNKTRGGD